MTFVRRHDGKEGKKGWGLRRESAGDRLAGPWGLLRAFPIHPREALRTASPAHFSLLWGFEARAPSAAFRWPGVPLPSSPSCSFESEPEVSLLAGTTGSG